MAACGEYSALGLASWVSGFRRHRGERAHRSQAGFGSPISPIALPSGRGDPGRAAVREAGMDRVLFDIGRQRGQPSSSKPRAPTTDRHPRRDVHPLRASSASPYLTCRQPSPAIVESITPRGTESVSEATGDRHSQVRELHDAVEPWRSGRPLSVGPEHRDETDSSGAAGRQDLEQQPAQKPGPTTACVSPSAPPMTTSLRPPTRRAPGPPPRGGGPRVR